MTVLDSYQYTHVESQEDCDMLMNKPHYSTCLSSRWNMIILKQVVGELMEDRTICNSATLPVSGEEYTAVE